MTSALLLAAVVCLFGSSHVHAQSPATGASPAVPAVPPASEGAARVKPVEDSLKYIADGQLANVLPADWVEVARVMGDPSIRSVVMEQLRKAEPFPARPWVDMLAHHDLTVRLGALEVLEDYTGHDLEFDPWEADPEQRKESLARWSAWADGGGKALPGTSGATTLSTEMMQGYLRDIMSGEPAPAERAMAKLKPFSHQAIGFIETFLTTQSSLLEGMRGRLKEAQYRLLLDLAGVRDARLVARNLAIGTRDQRVEGLDLISSAPKTVLPMVGELLRDPDALVRERAMDVLLSIGKAGTIPLAEQHLKGEKDANVIHAAIRALGKIESSTSVRTLTPYLTSDDEDMVATTLQSLSLLGSQAHSAKVQIEGCLQHSAWRVRAAALQCITKIRLGGLERQIAELIDDDDSFVRAAAVMALASVAGDSGGYGSFPPRGRSSPSDGVDVTQRLVDAFEKHDDLKAIIFKAFGQMKKAVPPELLDSLGDLPPDILVSALATLDNGNAEQKVLLKFAAHTDLDVSCTALRTLAKFSSSSKEVKPVLVMALLGKNAAKRDAVLDNVRWSAPASGNREWEAALKNFQFEQPQAPAPSPVPKVDSLEKQLMRAFIPGGEAAATTPPVAPAAGDVPPGKPKGLVDSLANAFTPKKPSGDVAATATQRPSAPVTGELIEDALNHLAGSADLSGTGEASRVARQAALTLVIAGSDWAVRHYEPVLSKLDVQDRAELADALDRNPSPAYLPTWQALFNDPSREVRQRAMRSALEDEKRTAVIRFGLMQLMQPKTLLTPAEAYGYSIESLARDDNTKKLMLESARQMVAVDKNPPLQILGLIILRQSVTVSDRELVAKLAKSPYYWVRRAAVLTLGRVDSKVSEEMFPAIAADSSAWVREAGAASYGKALKAWKHHFDDNTEVKDELYESDYDFNRSSGRFGSSGGSSALKPETIELLRMLTRDSEERVQLCAWLALLVNRQEVDVEALCALLDRSPDRETWSHRLADFVETNYKSLGPALRPLLERVEWKYIQANKVPAIEKHFGIGGSDGKDMGMDFAAYAESSGPATALVPAPQFVTPAPGSEAEPLYEIPLTAEVNAVFFYNPGCPDCETVRRDLAALKRRFTGLKVQEHNIRDTQAVLLNEALSRRFAVPPDKRQVSPAVFFQEGVLIKSDLNRFAMENLIQDTLRAGDSAMWFQTQKEEIAAAKEVVQQRFEGLQLMGVFMAGLLDGINPCAFATIIFFLSYMQVTRRSPRGILAVGVAFIAGVFISYFVLGLGLVEVVSRIEAFRTAAMLLNWALAIACLVIAYLSIRDARLAREGRLQDMALQLPGFLKTGIRGVIRTGAKSSHFVIAAFVSGIIIAALELACTGQVYLPTIVYAMKTGIASATGFLLLYNVAFIVPLVVIFILAWRGMRSEALIRFQKTHTATVKYALGALFLLLFFMIVWSGRL
ncbi:HEAT repeat domain-containing protein [Roseimicrobium gellanilyticum]|nr:HEAT repeat domain-containing protein [Roseimicrobium gellanilyticum]